MQQLIYVSDNENCLIKLIDFETGVVQDSLKSLKVQNQLEQPILAAIGMLPSNPGNRILFAAMPDKPLILAWSGVKAAIAQKYIVPELLSSIVVSPSSAFLVGGGVSGRIYCWSVKTGNLLRSWDAHYKKVSSLVFTVDEVRLVSTSADSTSHVWLFKSNVLNSCQSDIVPYTTLSGHSLPITGIHVSSLLHQHARYFTCSLDSTVKIWSPSSTKSNSADLSSNENNLIATILFPRPITCCTVDSREVSLFAGDLDGLIYKSNLYKTPDDSSSENIFNQHTGGQIESLCLSMDETLLVSACTGDKTCVLWDVATRASLRTIKHVSGPALFTISFSPLKEEQAPLVNGKAERKKGILPTFLSRFVSEDSEAEAESALVSLPYATTTTPTRDALELIEAMMTTQQDDATSFDASSPPDRDRDDELKRLRQQNRELLDLTAEMYQKLLQR